MAVCGKCLLDVPSDDVVVCTACQNAFHPDCVDLSQSLARQITDPVTNIAFLCGPCKSSVPNIVRDVRAMKAELELLKNQHVSVSPVPDAASTDHNSLAIRLGALEAKLDSFMSSFDMEALVTRIATRVAESVSNATSNAIMDSMREFAELERKKDNVVVFGLKPVDGSADVEVVKGMLADVGIGMGNDPVESCWRDGPSFPDKPRLLKVKFRSSAARTECLARARAKAFPQGIFIRRDMTYRERMARKEASSRHVNQAQFLRDVYPVVDVAAAVVSPSLVRNVSTTNSVRRSLNRQ